MSWRTQRWTGGFRLEDILRATATTNLFIVKLTAAVTFLKGLPSIISRTKAVCLYLYSLYKQVALHNPNKMSTSILIYFLTCRKLDLLIIHVHIEGPNIPLISVPVVRHLNPKMFKCLSQHKTGKYTFSNRSLIRHLDKIYDMLKYKSIHPLLNVNNNFLWLVCFCLVQIVFNGRKNTDK